MNANNEVFRIIFTIIENIKYVTGKDNKQNERGQSIIHQTT